MENIWKFRSGPNPLPLIHGLPLNVEDVAPVEAKDTTSDAWYFARQKRINPADIKSTQEGKFASEIIASWIDQPAIVTEVSILWIQCHIEVEKKDTNHHHRLIFTAGRLLQSTRRRNGGAQEYIDGFKRMLSGQSHLL